jgi:hypothetical protein
MKSLRSIDTLTSTLNAPEGSQGPALIHTRTVSKFTIDDNGTPVRRPPTSPALSRVSITPTRTLVPPTVSITPTRTLVPPTVAPRATVPGEAKVIKVPPPPSASGVVVDRRQAVEDLLLEIGFNCLHSLSSEGEVTLYISLNREGVLVFILNDTGDDYKTPRKVQTMKKIRGKSPESDKIMIDVGGFPIVIECETGSMIYLSSGTSMDGSYEILTDSGPLERSEGCMTTHVLYNLSDILLNPSESSLEISSRYEAMSRADSARLSDDTPMREFFSLLTESNSTDVKLYSSAYVQYVSILDEDGTLPPKDAEIFNEVSIKILSSAKISSIIQEQMTAHLDKMSSLREAMRLEVESREEKVMKLISKFVDPKYSSIHL